MLSFLNRPLHLAYANSIPHIYIYAYRKIYFVYGEYPLSLGKVWTFNSWKSNLKKIRLKPIRHHRIGFQALQLAGIFSGYIRSLILVFLGDRNLVIPTLMQCSFSWVSLILWIFLNILQILKAFQMQARLRAFKNVPRVHWRITLGPSFLIKPHGLENSYSGSLLFGFSTRSLLKSFSFQDWEWDAPLIIYSMRCCFLVLGTLWWETGFRCKMGMSTAW